MSRRLTQCLLLGLPRQRRPAAPWLGGALVWAEWPWRLGLAAGGSREAKHREHNRKRVLTDAKGAGPIGCPRGRLVSHQPCGCRNPPNVCLTAQSHARKALLVAVQCSSANDGLPTRANQVGGTGQHLPLAARSGTLHLAAEGLAGLAAPAVHGAHGLYIVLARPPAAAVEPPAQVQVRGRA